MSKFFIIKLREGATGGVFRVNFKDASDYARGWSYYFPDICITEAAYKPEPKDVEVSWVVYYTINGTEFSEVFKTRKLARLEKKYLQEHGLYLGDVESIYIQREEVWVVNKKKVS